VAPVGTPSYTIEEDKLRLEVVGSKWMIYPTYSNGTVMRNEYITLDFAGWVYEIYQNIGKEANDVAIEQFTITPFTEMAANATARSYRFTSHLHNNASLVGSLQFGVVYVTIGLALAIAFLHYGGGMGLTLVL